VAAGTFIGYAGDIQEMIAEIIELNEKYPNANDQGLFGIWTYLHLNQPELVQLDTNSEIFWVTTHDWNLLQKTAQTKKEIINPNTNNKPVIIHNAGNNQPSLRKAYDAAFERITNTITTQNKIDGSFLHEEQRTKNHIKINNGSAILNQNPTEKLKILVWAINESRSKMEKMSAQLIETAQLFNIDIELFGIGKKHTEHKQRIWLLHEYLQDIHPETIILCMDGADTLFNDTSEKLLQKFLKFQTRILISAEKDFTYQHFHFKDKFDAIKSDYRYVNAGTFMGYAGDLLAMLTEIITLDEKFPNTNDQKLLGIWAYQYLHQPEIIQLDTNSEVFWVTTHDWYQLEAVAQTRDKIINPNTNTQPIIIHCVGNNFPPHRKAYNAAFKQIMGQPVHQAAHKNTIELQLPSGKKRAFHCSFTELKKIIEQEESIQPKHQVYAKEGVVISEFAKDMEANAKIDLLIKVQDKYLICHAALEPTVYELGYIPLITPKSKTLSRNFDSITFPPYIKPKLIDFYTNRDELKKQTLAEIKPFYDAYQQHIEVRLTTIKNLIDSLNTDVPIISTFNKAFIPFFNNFIASCDHYNIPIRSLALFFPMDEEAQDACIAKNVISYFQAGAYGNMPSEYHGYAREGYRNCMFMKNAIVQDVLTLGYDLIFTDVDVVFLQNPIPRLSNEVKLGSLDYLFMYDGPNKRDRPLHNNTGFFYVQNNPFAVNVWQFIFDNFDKMWMNGAQQAFVNQVISYYTTLGLRTKKLKQQQYINGHLLVGLPEQLETIPEDAFVVHASWTDSLKSKENILREYGLWYLE
jgi:hypothetical protein